MNSTPSFFNSSMYDSSFPFSASSSAWNWASSSAYMSFDGRLPLFRERREPLLQILNDAVLADDVADDHLTSGRALFASSTVKYLRFFPADGLAGAMSFPLENR